MREIEIYGNIHENPDLLEVAALNEYNQKR